MTRIHEYPEPAVLQTCIDFPSPETHPHSLEHMFQELKEACTKHQGAGLAGNQLGWAVRILVYRDAQKELQGLINPRITETSEETSEALEGCLSLPGVQVKITRPNEIVVEALNEAAHPVTLISLGMEARAIQHEIDHLDGKLIIDSLGRLDRKMVVDKFIKNRTKYFRRERQALRRIDLKRVA